MKKIAFILFLCICFTGCTTKTTHKLHGAYVSDMISDLEEDGVGQLQLSFDDKGNVYYCVSSECKEKYTYRQDMTHENVYFIQLEEEEIMIVLQDDNSFYVPYGKGEFKGNAVLMKNNSQAIMAPANWVEEETTE